MNGEKKYKVKERKTNKKPQEKSSPAKKRSSTKVKSPMGTSFDVNEEKKKRSESRQKTGAASNSKKESSKPSKPTPPRKKTSTMNGKTTPSTVAAAPKKRISSPKKSNKEFLPIELERTKTGKTESIKTTKTIVSSSAKTAKTEKTATTRRGKAKKESVKILFLGGVGEIGKNMTAIEYGDDIVIIDAGLTFPNGEDMPGVDSVVPDVTYLAQNRDRVRGVLLTHGHEDHIGGVPYLMRELHPDTPIYATKLTLMLTDNKLQEHHIQNVAQRVVKAGDTVKLGVFEVEFINVNHSISGACALAIRTPNGLIFHSGDFKIDLTPVGGAPIDLKRISELGKEGVLLYMGESTNIERVGYTMSETVVGTTLDHLFSENMNRRLIIATFASNVHRLQQIIDLAVKYRRKVALSGRSMFKVVDAAVKIGELRIPEGVLIDIEKTKNLFDGELLIVSTGSQGEPMSALTRMASGDFNKVTVGENDTIIISATPIPGNEKMIYRVINNLYKKGCKVVYESLEKIHVSGHACQEEHKILHTLLNPKFFIPVHGEYRHLKRHVQLAVSLGMKEHFTLIPEIGNCVELTEDSMKFGENIPAGTRLIDGEGVEDYGTSAVMKERMKMSSEGVFVVSVAVTGDYVINDPIIEARGCVFANNETEEEMRSLVRRALKNYDFGNANKEDLSAYIHKYLKNYFYKTTKQAPLIIITILDV